MDISKKQKNISLAVFAIYLFLLTWLILFKFSTNIDEIKNLNIRNINLIPFSEPAIINGKISFKEIIYNILVFVPLGVYVKILKPDWSFGMKILPGLFLSFIYETIQFIFAIGASDITDIIGNTLGSMAGLAVCALFIKLFKDKFVVIINITGLCIEISAFIIMAILFVANH